MQYIGSILAFGRHPRPRIGDQIENCPAALRLSALSLDYWVCIDRVSIIIRPPPPSGTTSSLSIQPPAPRPFFLYSLSPLAFHLSILSVSLMC